MNKIWLLSGATALSLLASPVVAEDDLPAYGDLYNVEWCPCNPEEPFDADGSVVLGKTVMCPCNGLYSGYKKGFDEAGPGDGINLAFPHSKTRRGRVGKGCSQTLDTNCNMGTIDGYRIRRLTPLECFRLQGFPDEMIEKAREIGLADSRLYKMAGNAVTVNVVEAVARKIAEVENGRT